MNLIELMNNVEETAYVFRAKDGNEYSLEEATKKGLEGKIVQVDNSNELKNYVFGKTRVGAADMEALAEIIGKDSRLYQAVYDSLSYLTQKKIK